MAQVQSTVYDDALQDLLDSLEKDKQKKKQLAFFQDIIAQSKDVSVQELQGSVDALVNSGTGSGKVRRCFRNVVQGLETYSGVMEVFVQVQPMPMAIIWGGLKILVQCASRHYRNLDKIELHVVHLHDVLSDLLACEDVHDVSVYGAKAVQRLLRAAYTSILEFWYYATKTLENPVASALFETQSLSRVVDGLERHWEHLCRIRGGAEAQLNKAFREKVLEESNLNEEMRKKELEEFVYTALERCAAEAEREAATKEREAAEAERAAAKAEREAQQHFRDTEEERRKEEKRTRFMDTLHRFQEELRSHNNTCEDKLGLGTVNDMYEDNLCIKTPGTCKWILEHPTFQEWKGADCERPILWLNGKHGSGKTYLCASVVDAISSEESQKGIAFLFINKGQDWPRSYLLRTLTYQLLDTIRTLDIADLASLEPLISGGPDLSKVEELIQRCLQLLPITFIFIDGLDEAEYAATSLPYNNNNKNRNGVSILVSFLIKQATDLPQKVRLWCSSQATQCVKNMLHPDWDKRVTQISLTTADTAGDIHSYIKSKIQGPKDFKDFILWALITSSVSTEVEGSFLWCRMMLDALSDESSETESIKDQIALIERGLPREMEELYHMIVKRIKKRYPSKKGIIPLWKTVLSILTFSRRPMRLCEIREAVAIIRPRNGDGQDFDELELVSSSKIVACCMSLVRRIPAIGRKRDDDDLLRLSHSSVWTYLMDNSDVSQEVVQSPLVESRIMWECCRRYLGQPRYSKLLEKRNDGKFCTASGEEIASHRLLTYAAKYWFRHCDMLWPEAFDGGQPLSSAMEDAIAEVKSFMISPNFRTCLQVQSICVVGHFLQDFDPLTDRARSARRTLPQCILRQEPEFAREYFAFQIEWCQLLELNPKSQYLGEIGRCFWGSLGEESFLSKHPGRYESFQIGRVTAPVETMESYRLQHLSLDGATITVMWSGMSGESRHVHLERWSIASAIPRLMEQKSMPFSAKATGIDRYPTQCSATFNSFPIVPGMSCIVLPDSIRLSPESALLRVGGKFFFRKTDGISDLEFTELKEKCFGDYWEDGCFREGSVGEDGSSRDALIVICRRRIPRPRVESSENMEREKRRVAAWRQRMSYFHEQSQAGEQSQSGSRTERPTSIPRFFKSLLRENGVLSATETSSDDSEDTNSTSEISEDTNSECLPDLSSPEDSWTEGSTDTENVSSDEIGSEDSDDAKPESDIEIRSAEEEVNDSDGLQNIEVESDYQDDSSGAESLNSASAFFQLPNSSSESEDEGDETEDSLGGSWSKDDILIENPLDEDKLVGITQRRGRVICKACNRKTGHEWYHCVSCSKDNFDLCSKCVHRGRWCLDLCHRLYRMIDGKPAGAVSRNNFSIRQELAVYQVGENQDPECRFHIRKKYNSLLYDSLPVIHPRHSLVVWPFTGSVLMFADIEHNRCFEQKLRRTSSKNSREICVNMSFSPCGGFLRVSTIDAVTSPPQRTSTDGKIQPKPRLCITLHVMILQLSSTAPSHSLPKMVASTSVDLGCSAKTLVSTLPFAFTWTPSYLYVTMSDSTLRVFRVALDEWKHVDQSQDPETPGAAPTAGIRRLQVTVPKETIFLPRSARTCSVQFFPAAGAGGKSKVIIGPRYGRNPGPPIGALLPDVELGGWVLPEKKEGGRRADSMSQKRLEGQLEEFDQEEDCDLILLDRYL
ncbi:vegetative incompatibility protein HET-E-1 [Apiospora arundinis]|uniref:Vegetative incompatibility protein HET-E-1 n=1 Tax=Apiospora arundinis TaxID=335852 RepID=A0ABR2HTA9_9PEZI